MSQAAVILPYMLPSKEQTHITENYVSSPPALIVVDETGAVWTLDNDIHIYSAPRGEYGFSVLRNGQRVGIRASRIERRNGKIRVFTRDGWRLWTGRSFF